MKKETLKLLKEILIEEMISATPQEEKKNSKLSSKAEKVLEIINASDFGCKKESIVKLISAVLEEDLEIDIFEPNSNSYYTNKKFCAVVPTNNTCGHNYKLGEVCFHKEQDCDYYLRQDGTIGNCLGNQYRYATKEEIIKFVDKFSFDKALFQF